MVLGAFQEECVGFICVRNLSVICKMFLVGNDYSIGKILLNQVIQLMYGKIYAIVLKHEMNFYTQYGFIIEEENKESVLMSYVIKDDICFSCYDEVHEFISKQKTRVYSLNNFKKFMHDLCNPQQLLNVIHIGGTNGKGSTTNYVRSVLQNAGYKVATFTSPVLVTRLEIMRINDIHITSREILLYANRYMKMWLEYELSMFEIEVFIAVMYFIRKQVDFAVFEVGLGGELDATNIVLPLVCANTNIGLDHVDYLGHSYREIAYAKAGIIKDGVAFITGEKREECLDVFREVCHKHHSSLIRVQDINHICECDHKILYDYRDLHVKLNTTAYYQCQNSALAIEILMYLQKKNYINITHEQLLQGLEQAKWAGRFEVMCKQPLVIIDGAHNKEGIEAFVESAKHYRDIKVIFSALKDKDTHNMISKLLELTDDVTVCEFDFYRSQTAKKLAESFDVKIIEDWHEAIDQSFAHDGTVFVTGSLYFIAQVRQYLLEKCKEM